MLESLNLVELLMRSTNIIFSYISTIVLDLLVTPIQVLENLYKNNVHCENKIAIATAEEK